MGAAAFGAGPSAPYGAPPSPSLAYSGAQQPQPPRFSAGSLISDNDLPDWMRAGPEGYGAQPAQRPAAPPAAPAPQAPQAAWGAPAQPAQPQGWSPTPDPFRQDIDAQHTIRQPAFGAPAPAAQPAPFAQQQGFAQQPYGQPAPFAQPAAGFGQPSGQPGYAQPAYPPQLAQPPMPASYPQQPAYGQAPASYPQAPTPGSYGGFPAVAPQPQRPATPVNAFPSIDQAGAAFSGPQVGGIAGNALLDQRSMGGWLGGAQPGVGPAASRPQASSGMQARSLVDDQALPKWLRDQPDAPAPANVSAWIGASATQEPMPPVLSEAFGQNARNPQFNGLGAPAAPAQNGYGASSLHQPPSPPRGDEAAMPDWLRAQAGNNPAQGGPQGAAFAPAQGGQPSAGGFAASDLIDPAALPDWVTGRAPAAPTFSSTQGWSAAQPEPEGAYGADGYQGDDQSYPQGYPQDGYAQDGYDQRMENGAYDSGDGSQGDGWAAGGWGGSDGQGDMASYQQSQPRNPLAPDELPPWLRGKGGAPAQPPRAANGPTRNPWAGAASPMESADAWNDDEPWDEDDAQPGQQGWGAASSGWDDRAGGRNERGRDMGAWEDELSMDWGEPAPDPRDSYDRPYQQRPHQHPHQRDPRAAAGYPDDPYGGGYDQMAGDYGEYDDEYDDDEASSARKGGRGWLGFLRRDKR